MLLTALGGKILQMRKKKLSKEGGPIPVYLWKKRGNLNIRGVYQGVNSWDGVRLVVRSQQPT
jgi:hypothetical protein